VFGMKLGGRIFPKREILAFFSKFLKLAGRAEADAYQPKRAAMPGAVKWQGKRITTDFEGVIY
jgi:hypothetical protein